MLKFVFCGFLLSNFFIL